MATTLQTLSLPSNSTFDQPASFTGRQWKTAFGYLATCPGWASIAWGRHLEDQERITLFIDWNDIHNARNFLTSQYAKFAALLLPILATAPHPPCTVDVQPNVVEPAALGGQTTITKLRFTSLSANQRFNLLAPTFNCYVQELDLERDNRAAGFKGGSASWELDAATGAHTTTLWTLVSWENLDAEEQCEKNFRTLDGRNSKEAFLGAMLAQADSGGDSYHVAWEWLSPEMMEWWKDSENAKWPYKPVGT